MALNHIHRNVSEQVGFSSPIGTVSRKSAGYSRHKVGQVRQSDAVIVQCRSKNAPKSGWLPRYGRVTVALTVAALLIGAVMGGWLYAAILASIALGQCLAVSAHDRTLAVARPAK